mgnify:CR=1 FL=1
MIKPEAQIHIKNLRLRTYIGFNESEKENFKKKLLPLHKEMVKSIGGQASKIYNIIQKAKKEFKNKVHIHNTFLAAHAIPKKFSS